MPSKKRAMGDFIVSDEDEQEDDYADDGDSGEEVTPDEEEEEEEEDVKPKKKKEKEKAAKPPPAKKSKKKHDPDDDSEEEALDVKPASSPKAKAKAKLKASASASTSGGSGGGKVKLNEQGEAYIELSKKRRLTVRKFNGTTLVDIREYYQDKADGKDKPGKKGISLQVDDWKVLKDGMSSVDGMLAAIGK